MISVVSGICGLFTDLIELMLESANLGPSEFLVFYYNFVKRGPFATKFCTLTATDNMNKYCKFGYFTISTFFVCAYIVAKPYVSIYGLATIYALTRK